MPSVLALLARGGLQLAIASAIGSPVFAQTTPQAEVEVARFDILEYRVLGNTVLPREKIERAVAPFLGEKRTVNDVEAARAALEQTYQQAGFGSVLVDTPEQRVAGGVVTLQVIEARVSRLRVVGAKYYSQGRILEQVPSVAEGQVVNYNRLTEELGSLNRVAGRRVSPLLRPGKVPGTSEVDLQVEDQSAFHGGVELNNKHAPNTTPMRLVGTLRYDNLWQREHSASLMVQTSPQDTDEVRIVSGSYKVPEGEGAWLMSLTVSRSSTRVALTGSQATGSGETWGLRRMYFGGTDKRQTAFTLGADYKDMNGKTDDTVDCSDIQNCTPVRYLPLSTGYSVTEVGKRAVTQGGVTLVLGLRGLIDNNSQFANKRYQAQSNFASLKFDFSRTQKLRRGFELSARMEGQVANQPLISDEQFTAGGVDSVRGYLQGGSVGDQGLRLSFELRSPDLSPLQKDPWLRDLRVHGFLDGAGVWTKAVLPEQDRREGLIGMGAGLRLRIGQHGSLSLDVARAMRAAGSTEQGEVRGHVSGSLEF
ncbi:ShlB/FhaC/HecB family hemolysin secretion/activation protein [Piscinibacter sp. HJYY11]|uniref:ShlB/FhaC/HecB family hemolysin secretion/activation protein n=1 Tax=Piscinibacter sp. HJYY11 TaxID=2801333 RepID=UPI0019202D83|nr:ShlB/FhaC/HecB family hemolysin secretion/activation protein [Piscinibacter sp. HJYY11]MBL0726180.1 ShlB/FhaC/HecB family hemolysin secretion/activation protein [Piscinibacter sp. HJYY11]